MPRPSSPRRWNCSEGGRARPAPFLALLRADKAFQDLFRLLRARRFPATSSRSFAQAWVPPHKLYAPILGTPVRVLQPLLHWERGEEQWTNLPAGADYSAVLRMALRESKDRVASLAVCERMVQYIDNDWGE